MSKLPCCFALWAKQNWMLYQSVQLLQDEDLHVFLLHLPRTRHFKNRHSLEESEQHSWQQSHVPSFPISEDPGVLQFSTFRFAGPEPNWSSSFQRLQERHDWFPGWMRLWAAWSAGWRPCPWQGGWNWMIFEVLFNPGHSMIPRLYDLTLCSALPGQHQPILHRNEFFLWPVSVLKSPFCSQF